MYDIILTSMECVILFSVRGNEFVSDCRRHFAGANFVSKSRERILLANTIKGL
jgi:hypothetical protein